MTVWPQQRHRLFAVALLGVAVLVAALAFVARRSPDAWPRRGFAAWSSAARLGLPARCERSVRLRLAELLNHPALAREVVPWGALFGSLGASGPSASEMLAAVGAERVDDIEELAVCASSARPGVVALLRGKLRHGAQSADGGTSGVIVSTSLRRGREVTLWRNSAGGAFYVVHGLDGTVLVATDESLLDAALIDAEQGRAEAARVDGGMLAVFIADGGDTAPARQSGGGKGVATLVGTRRLIATLSRGMSTLTLRMQFDDVGAADAAVRRLLALQNQIALRIASLRTPRLPRRADAEAVFAAAQVSSAGRDAVITANLDSDSVSALADLLGRQVADVALRYGAEATSSSSARAGEPSARAGSPPVGTR